MNLFVELFGDGFSNAFALITLETKSFLSKTQSRVLFQCLINCPEGAQRIFTTEHVDTSKIACLLLTSNEYSCMNGFAGLYFAMSDVGAASIKIRGPKQTENFIKSSCQFCNRQYPALSCLENVERETIDEKYCTIASFEINTALVQSNYYCLLCNNNNNNQNDESNNTKRIRENECATRSYLLSFVKGKSTMLILSVGEDNLVDLETFSVLKCHPPNLILHACTRAIYETAIYQNFLKTECSSSVNKNVFMHEYVEARSYQSVNKRTNELNNNANCYYYPFFPPVSSSSSTPPTTRGMVYLFEELQFPREKAKATTTTPMEEEEHEETTTTSNEDNNNNNSHPRLVFYGTGASRPSILRGLSCIHLFASPTYSVLLDCGEDTINQMQYYAGQRGRKQKESMFDLALQSIEMIWISHHHLDHHGGVVSIIQERFRKFRLKTLLFGPTSVGAHLKNVCPSESFLFFSNLEAVEKSNGFFTHVIRAEHCFDSWCCVCLVNKEVTVLYSGDTRPIGEKIKQHLFGKAQIDFVIHESTFEESFSQEAVSKKHSTIRDAVNVALQLNCNRLILTHLSQRYPMELPDFEKIKQEHNFFIFHCANDFFTINL